MKINKLERYVMYKYVLTKRTSTYVYYILLVCGFNYLSAYITIHFVLVGMKEFLNHLTYGVNWNDENLIEYLAIMERLMKKISSPCCYCMIWKISFYLRKYFIIVHNIINYSRYLLLLLLWRLPWFLRYFNSYFIHIINGKVNMLPWA